MKVDGWTAGFLNELGKVKYPLLIVLLGLLLMLLPGKTTVQNTEEPAVTEPAEVESISVEEEKLANLLSKIQGAGAVEVMLSLRTGEHTIYQTDTQRQTGSEEETLRQETVLYAAGSGQQSALIQQVQAPVYQGAIILCQGADNPEVKLALVEAVSSITGLGADRITVVKMR